MQAPPKPPQRLLVGIGSGPISEQLLRRAQSQAVGLNCPWIAVHIECGARLAKSAQERLDRNLILARELGAEVITTPDADVVRGLLQVAEQKKVTQIIVGKSVRGPLRRFFQRDTLHRRLCAESGELAVQVVRVDLRAAGSSPRSWKMESDSNRWQYLTALLVIAGITLAAKFIIPNAGYRAIAFIYLLAVVVMASFVGRGPTLLAAMASALGWNFFFEAPIYSFRISGLEDQILFGMYFVVALVLGQLTARIRAQEKAERQLGERATALYLLNQELAQSTNLDEILRPAVRQLRRTFNAEIAILLPDSSNHLAPQRYAAATLNINQEEMQVADWVYKHRRPAGKFAENLPQGEALFLPLLGSRSVLGVVGVQPNQSFTPSLHQRNLLEAFSQQIALAIDRLHMREFLEESKILAESERLSKTLLNSMSHEFRTPLAVIQAASCNLVGCRENDLSKSQHEMVGEIREATERLNRLVGNVLDITRLESGRVRAKSDFRDVSELVKEAVADSRSLLARHKVTVEVDPELPFVRMDMALMHQALFNLLANAAFHTPEGTEVEVIARVTEGTVVIKVADHGPGVDPAHLPRLFNKFYRAPDAPTGGTGLGLSIVKGFVEAQGGQVKAENRAGGGMVFSIIIPVEKTSQALAEHGLSVY